MAFLLVVVRTKCAVRAETSAGACIDVYRVTNAGDAYAYYHAWFRFRLLGSELVARAGYDMTGKMADDLPSSENRSVLLGRCHD